MKILISANELLDNLSQYTIIDLRSESAYGAGHIAGAISLPVGNIPLKSGAQIVTETNWASYMGSCGVRSEDTLLVYDNGITSRAVSRFWYVAKYYGHENVFILNGGFDAARDIVPVTEDVPEIIPAIYTPKVTQGYILDLNGVMINRDNAVLLDVRSVEEFSGSDRYGNPRNGHINGAVLAVLGNFVPDEPGQSYANPEKLAHSMNKLGVQKEDFIIAYCQIGIRAAVGGLALRVAGFDNVLVYEGSVFEWSRMPELELLLGMDNNRRVIAAASVDDDCG